jgi:LemA protein
MKKSTWIILAVVAVIIIWAIGANNKMVRSEESVKAGWSQVENVYQRRMDLIPNLVNTVKGAANYEKSTLEEVITARSNANKVQVNADNLTEENIAKFQKAQDNLGSALSRSINLTVERYPQLTATKNFQDLQAQIEGTENRITVERHNFNETVNAYNKLIRTFPNNIIAGIFGFDRKGYFTATSGADKAPNVQFE